MKTSQEGIDLIKRFEGFRGKAYKALPSEKYTIGYGHYSADVKWNDIWSQEKAEEVLKKDLEWAEDAVKTISPALPQSAFDALVSFTFNCGPANLRSLCRNRSLSDIADALLLYNKAGGKTDLAFHKRGLTGQRGPQDPHALQNTRGSEERPSDGNDLHPDA